MEAGQYDFIVIGGGTAGLVVAGRLADNPAVKILVIEAGDGNPEQVEEIKTPALAFNLPETQYDWKYETTMVDKPGFRRVEPANTRGKVLGGSSCLNYFTWLRGSAATYDEWADYGGPDWTFSKSFPYFLKSAYFHDDDNTFRDGEPRQVGANSASSPLNIAPAVPIPLAQPLTDAWESRGYHVSSDKHPDKVNGLIHVVRSIYNGERSTSNCFIKGKANIEVIARTIAENVIIKQGVAKGVVVRDTSCDARAYYAAAREVIVSSGVFESPKLLMLSGIGPQEDLLSHEGLTCLVHSAHVGKHLQDHPAMPHVFRVRENYSMDHILRPGAEHEEAKELYRRHRTGPLTSGLLEMSAFPRIDERLRTCKEWRDLSQSMTCDPLGPQEQPHFELDFVPCFAKPFQPHIDSPTEGSYLTVIVSLLRPLSRGEVTLRSGKPTDQPEINLNFLAEAVDVVALREGVRFIDEVLQRGHSMKDILQGEYPEPIPRDSDEAMDGFIHKRVTTGYHPCGTCRLGKTIEQGVVNARLQVHGVKSLRVIDASIFPLIPDCRIQNAVYMVAEKGAQLIKEDHLDLYRLEEARMPDALAQPSHFLKRIFQTAHSVLQQNREVLRQALS